MLFAPAPEKDVSAKKQPSGKKVDPPPQLPSRPNLSRQFGDAPPKEDYLVELPAQNREPSPGPTYSNLAPGRRRA